MKYMHERLNLVLLGRSGVGKSSSGNTILGREAFKSKKSSKSLTKDVSVECGTVDQLLINVYDTPGLFDTDKNEGEIQKKLEKVFQRCESGPCVFLLVIKADRFTEEETKTVEKIEELLGEKRLKKTWILFTGGDQLEEENIMIEEFIIETEALKKLIQKYSLRYHVFNNKKKRHIGQVKELLTKIPQLYFDALETTNLGKTGVGKSYFSPVSPVMAVNDLLQRKQEEKQRQKDNERLRREARYRAEIEAQQKETSYVFLLKHHIYIAAIATVFLIGGAVGGAVAYGVVGGAVGGAVGGTAIGALGGAAVGGAVTGVISVAAVVSAVGGAVVGALGGAAVGAAVGAAIVGGASAAGVGAVAKAVGVAVVGGAAVGGAVGGASKRTIKGAVEGTVVGGAAVSGAAVGGATAGAALSGAVGGAAVCGAVAGGAVVGAALGGAASKNGVGALCGGAAVGGAVVFGVTVGGATGKVVAEAAALFGEIGGMAVGGVAVGGAAVGGVAAGRKNASHKLVSGAAVDIIAMKNCTKF